MEECRRDVCVLLHKKCLQMWQFKTNTCLLWEVSVGQESGHDLAVSSARCLTWLWSRCLVELVSAEAGIGSGLPPSSLRLLAEFISLWF